MVDKSMFRKNALFSTDKARVAAFPRFLRKSRPDKVHIGRTELRYTRFIMAACCSAAISVLTAVFYFLGMMEANAALSTVTLVLGLVLLFALVFRLGLNHRAIDPSMTVEMTTASVLSLLYAMYVSSIARDAFVSFFGVVLLFSIFRFSTRVVFYFAAMIFAGYGLVIAITRLGTSPTSSNTADIARWLSLGVSLPLFAIIGGQIMNGRRAAARRLGASEERFRRLTELSSDWYWEQDENLRFAELSPKAQEKIGIMSSRLIGKTLQNLAYEPNSMSLTAFQMSMQSRQPYSNIEFSVVDDCGKLRWLSMSGEPLFDKNYVFQGYYGTGRDVTKRKQAEQAVQFLAHHDTLTGLPNRTLLYERLNSALAKASSNGQEMWVLFLDLDRFKLINDSLGHGTGDLVLKKVSERLQTMTREDDMLARLGGDEFVLVLQGSTKSELEIVLLDRIMTTICAPVEVGGEDLSVACSIGIAAYPADGTTADTLIEHADVAMYRAKESGRQTWKFYKSEMNEAAISRLRIENDLRSALDRGEFVLYYQPQIDLRTGTVIGVEALIRWEHPESGLLPPAAFISVAEDIGLIIPIGAWVVKQACLQAMDWQKRGFPPIRMAVNLSARQFSQQGLSHVIAQTLQSTGFNPSLLELEITENLMMSNVEDAASILADLRSLGVAISVDDFGTGYSSLYYLKRFPINVLKIDRSFVRDITTDRDDAAIVAAIVALAQSLGLKVVAEGVELEEQAAYLIECGCDAAQGYLYSKPVRPEVLENMLEKGYRSASYLALISQVKE
jgi:diguanylate cyclase (GGDEF)-like protein/PAS domain S-box-containing protein